MGHVDDAPKVCRDCGAAIVMARDERDRVVRVESVPAVLPAGLGDLHWLGDLRSDGDGGWRFSQLGRPLYRAHVCPATGEAS